MNRTLTEILNKVFDFVGENWRQWFKIMIYYLLPFSALLGTTLASVYRGSFTSMPDMAYAVSIALFIVGCAVVTALQILLVKWYDTHNYTLEGCNAATLWREMPKTFLKCLGIVVLGTPFVALAITSIIIPIVGFILVFAGLPVFMVCPIMILESQKSLLGSIKRAFSLGYKKWWSLILVAVVMVLVAILINNAITFPLGIFMVLQSTLELETHGSVIWSFIIDCLFYIMSVAECFIIFVEIGLFVLAMTYHYGNVAAEVEDIGLESDIDNFAHLK